MPQPDAFAIGQGGDVRQLIDAQLAALSSPCSCRANAQCRALMESLARIGALPSAVLTMTAEEWAAGCGIPTQLIPPVAGQSR